MGQAPEVLADGVGAVVVVRELVSHPFRYWAGLLGFTVYRLFSFWLPIVPALLLLPAVRGLPLELRRVERESGSDSGAGAGVRA